MRGNGLVGILHFNIYNTEFTVVFITAVGSNNNMSAYRAAVGFISEGLFSLY